MGLGLRGTPEITQSSPCSVETPSAKGHSQADSECLQEKETPFLLLKMLALVFPWEQLFKGPVLRMLHSWFKLSQVQAASIRHNFPTAFDIQMNPLFSRVTLRPLSSFSQYLCHCTVSCWRTVFSGIIFQWADLVGSFSAPCLACGLCGQVVPAAAQEWAELHSDMQQLAA